VARTRERLQTRLDALNFVARSQTRILQNGYLRYYLITIIGTTVATVGFPLLSQGQLDVSCAGRIFIFTSSHWRF
jgi:hypothetical protein